MPPPPSPFAVFPLTCKFIHIAYLRTGVNGNMQVLVPWNHPNTKPYYAPRTLDVFCDLDPNSSQIRWYQSYPWHQSQVILCTSAVRWNALMINTNIKGFDNFRSGVSLLPCALPYYRMQPFLMFTVFSLSIVCVLWTLTLNHNRYRRTCHCKCRVRQRNASPTTLCRRVLTHL